MVNKVLIPMIIASKLPNGLMIGNFAIKGAMLGHEDHQKANAPGRERIAGYEITRNVPDDQWKMWYSHNANGPIIANRLIGGFVDGDDQGLNEFCWANARVRGWAQAPQDGWSG